MKRFFKRIILLREKLSMWGLKGVVDYLKRQRQDYELRRYFIRNARRFPNNHPEPGITIIGFFSDGGWSLSKVLRDFAFSLRDAGIPFQTYDTGNGTIHKEDLDGILTPVSKFRIRRYSHVVEFLSSPLPDGIVANRYRIAFWEFNEGVEHAFHPLVEKDDGIIAMSSFNYEFFRKVFGKRVDVAKILYPLRLDTSFISSKEECRAKFGLEAGSFVVFCNFAYSSGWWRKNPVGTVKAFAKAFRDIPEALLVFKTSAREQFPEREKELRSVVNEEGVSCKTVFVDDWLSQRDLYSLTNTCDVCVSLHRAEGFGIAIAEAMIMAKAVVVTDYSGPTEFCNADNSIPVPYQIVEVHEDQKDAVWYRDVKYWAEPDIDAAADALRRLHDDGALRKALGSRARSFIEKTFSTDCFRQSVEDFLSVNAPAKPAAVAAR